MAARPTTAQRPPKTARRDHPGASAPRAESRQLRAENRRLRTEVSSLRAEKAALEATVARLEARIGRLQAKVDELRRATRRQAAPFSRDDPDPEPSKPGRRAGEDYGKRAHRSAPERVDERIEVPLPAVCPHCGADEVVGEGVARQWVEDLLIRPWVRLYELALGRCSSCGKRVQARHPDQTSDALGAAAAQVGPQAVALAAFLNKSLGLPVAKCAQVLRRLGGIEVTPGGLTGAIARAARAAEPTYQALCEGAASSEVVSADETGWRVEGLRQWLWAFSGDGVTAYLIAPGRGFGEAAEVLGEDFSGVLERDGWAPYRLFESATHQSCLAHLLRRCHEMISDSVAGQARLPHALRRILRDALGVRDAHRAGEIGEEALAEAVAGLEARLSAFCARSPGHEPNRRLMAHVRREAPHLLTFLRVPGVAATNHRAERDLRPAVVNRKHWGGNRTWAGAHTTEVLMSVLRTCWHQGVDPIGVLVDLLRRPTPGVTPALEIPRRPQGPEP